MKTDKRRYLLFVATIIVVAFLVGVIGLPMEVRAEVIEGNGRIVEQHRTVGLWDKIKINGGYHIFFTQCDKRGVIVKADENLQEIIRTEVHGDVLVIESSRPLNSRSALQVMISNPHLTEVSANAAARFITRNELSAPKLKLTANAAAFIDVKGAFQNLHASQKAGSTIKLAGEAQALEVRSTAGGTIDAFGLKARSARVEVDAGASANVSTSQLNAKASSGGTINYAGTPVISSMKVNSGGKVMAR